MTSNIIEDAAETTTERHLLHMELDSSERDVLEAALDSYLADLRSEIADTDNSDFKGMLKERRDVLAKITAQLRLAA